MNWMVGQRGLLKNANHCHLGCFPHCSIRCILKSSTWLFVISAPKRKGGKSDSASYTHSSVPLSGHQPQLLLTSSSLRTTTTSQTNSSQIFMPCSIANMAESWLTTNPFRTSYSIRIAQASFGAIKGYTIYFLPTPALGA